MVLKDKLIDLRKSNNLTQEQLASELRISLASIKKYESKNNYRLPEREVLKLYVEYFNVSYDYLLNDSISNKTTENIHIEKILNLSDSSIENLKTYSHEALNSIIGSDIFKNFNQVLNYYWYISSTSTKLRFSSIVVQYFKEMDFTTLTTPKIEDLEHHTKEIYKITNDFNLYKEKNQNFSFYVSNNDELDDTISTILNKEYCDDEILSLYKDLLEYILAWESTLENGRKILKLEIIENLTNSLNSLNSF